jgi:hypothetical protein
VIKDIRNILYLINLLESEKKKMQKANVSGKFFESVMLDEWLDEMKERKLKWEWEKKVNFGQNVTKN